MLFVVKLARRGASPLGHSLAPNATGINAFRRRGVARHFVGQEAIYSSCPNQQVMTTECPVCNYLMAICSLDGRVIETSSSQFTVTAKEQSKSIIKPQIIAFDEKISA
ncbi:hypothetical protein H1P_1090009 [Hyella patelloides LEGE 07179]|uniref:Uncharacterized protein n=1 Tax=Hyella patelloides LEGE 07179 TaxID=945734 RepID=A0A563VJI6_9CYAN|nr:hypothetical protein [Hyella patelloides]VEP11543.1 hypothetical protein H1P_1090009 [Hyella patelloides LEGE 07179]